MKRLRTLELPMYPSSVHDYDAEHLFFHNSDISRPEPFGPISRDTGRTTTP